MGPYARLPSSRIELSIRLQELRELWIKGKSTMCLSMGPGAPVRDVEPSKEAGTADGIRIRLRSTCSSVLYNCDVGVIV